MVSKKTDPLFLGRPPDPAKGRRNTDLMGLPAIEEPAFRDTIKDDSGPLEQLIPPGVDPSILDPAAAAQKKGAFLAESSQNQGLKSALGQLREPETPNPRGGTMPMSARIEALEAEVPVGKKPAPVGGKVDLSRADPRRAPTERVAKRPNELLEPDWSVAHRPPPGQPAPLPAPQPQQSQLFNYALAVFGLLAFVLVALVVYLKVLR
jgi:hypothetical protein